MKKISILAIALIVSLPGCFGRKKESAKPVRKNDVERYMQTDGNVNDLESFDGEDMDDLDDLLENDDTDLSDEELADLDSFDINELDTPMDEYEDEIDEDIMDDSAEYAWIDAQTDDEFKKLYFSFNHYGIKPDQKETMNYNIEQVKQLVAESGSAAQPTIVIEGHACQEGAPAYNLALSEKRAKNVADFFVAAGVDRSTIKVVGRGQECPIARDGKAINGSREDRAPNRRVEVRVIYT
ncbi:MAG TPA: OmpA family protein [Candidatus Babeliales bacterium]|nr:OmpA family protein [Candidatus Babeliales bacterium]